MRPERPVLTLSGTQLTRAQVCAVAAGGVTVVLDPQQLRHVRRAADFLAEQARCGESIYGVTTGFGSNADKLLGNHNPRERPQLPPAAASGNQSLLETLQRNLIVTHAVCVGTPWPAEVVRAMMVIRINTLMRGHSGIREPTLQALCALLNAGVVPVIPQKGSVGASGDLAPLSHLAMVLLGEGEAFYRGERLPGATALQRAGLEPVRLSCKEGLALNNGTTQMLACACLALERLERLAQLADLAAAMSLEAFAGRRDAFAESVHALRPHPGQVQVAAHLRQLLSGSTLSNAPYHLVPRFETWQEDSWAGSDAGQGYAFDLRWDYVPGARRHGREGHYRRFKPFKGGKKHQPQDAYCLRCIPQVHGAVRDALAQAQRVVDIELNAVTDNPLIFPDAAGADAVVSAGHFHGMPLALAMSYVKASIPVLAGISERRLNKLLDPATNDGLPAFLIGNADATDSGFMIVQYTAAALVNDLATRAHPASVYSIPTSANAEDHVSMGANEARHVWDMTEDLSHVLALELYTAAQALDYRKMMLKAAAALAKPDRRSVLQSKIIGIPQGNSDTYKSFLEEFSAFCQELASTEFEPAPAVAHCLEAIRQRVEFMWRDRAMDQDVRVLCDWLASGQAFVELGLS